MTLKLETIAEDVLRRAEGRSRFIVAIAGPPGAGKSTLADALCDALLARGETAAVLPMDGFHMDNGILEGRGLLPRKGAPETFDVRGFLDIVSAVRRGGQEVLVPVFDRSREIAIASARAIAPETRFILAEGNYLLLDEAPWTTLSKSFDVTIFVGPSVDVLEERLRKRWQGYGLDEAAIHAKLFENDLPNGKRVIENARPADIHIDIWE
ncbi:nucleoside triphosphate hydrolase [Agrobacterium tumefaciens]|uniref:Nucleoside triphosphate hydrolase n=1 Tax=Agrobacterium tumefaciens TaxID=358 RepID=A0A2L2L718_AGRTU|nr:nucleoside triphosphate hydrolase [Agrobacterium tumefaciens]AVH40111.1 nucleoside triphosphate hydrolase [Agrobacterium tumefaciens]NSY94092.1 nucleoside triphosphate hydrolase [Agrobacterium tumefaciens]NSZ01984.1 nucleoside triphosphate hydrolase [Agrobacterium tumefaciens]NSZ40087.1 nucleoside triphosphate hydrolase [Agrobacterium tumefaciens]NTB00643.1 nucleoside triphosphate hydrolase [Agrobacterium tumefaciens]